MKQLTAQHIFADALTELSWARENFPTNEDMTLVYAEEAGELVKAMLDTKQKPHKTTSKDVYKEGIQAIAMAMRLLLEGDPSLPGYAPDKVLDTPVSDR